MPSQPSSSPTAANATAAQGTAPDPSGLTYEQARDELTSIVSRLEAGQLGLDESLALWERGEALAAHCSGLLDRAEQKLDAASGQPSESTDEA